MKVTFPGGLRVDAEYKGRTIPTDQPKYSGGDDSAPAPFDLFLASIATCSGIYIVYFCKEREIPTDDISLTMRTEKDQKTRTISRFIIDVHLPPDFPEKYEGAVKRAIDQCAVKRTMDLGPEFVVTMKRD